MDIFRFVVNNSIFALITFNIEIGVIYKRLQYDILVSRKNISNIFRAQNMLFKVKLTCVLLRTFLSFKEDHLLPSMSRSVHLKII